MLRIDALVRRRRTAVLAVWLAVVVAAVPLAMRQADHLTGGGYEVPGSDSQQVERSLGRDFDAGAHATLAAVLVPQPNATAADVRAAVSEVGAAAGATENVALTP